MHFIFKLSRQKYHFSFSVARPHKKQQLSKINQFDRHKITFSNNKVILKQDLVESEIVFFFLTVISLFFFFCLFL